MACKHYSEMKQRSQKSDAFPEEAADVIYGGV